MNEYLIDPSAAPVVSSNKRMVRDSQGRLWAVVLVKTGVTDFIKVSFSTDNGQTWTVQNTTGQTSNNTSSAFESRVDICIDSSDTIYIFYTSEDASNIWINEIYRDPYTFEWSEPVNISGDLAKEVIGSGNWIETLNCVVDSTDQVYVVYDYYRRVSPPVGAVYNVHYGNVFYLYGSYSSYAGPTNVSNYSYSSGTNTSYFNGHLGSCVVDINDSLWIFFSEFQAINLTNFSSGSLGTIGLKIFQDGSLITTISNVDRCIYAAASLDGNIHISYNYYNNVAFNPPPHGFTYYADLNSSWTSFLINGTQNFSVNPIVKVNQLGSVFIIFQINSGGFTYLKMIKNKGSTVVLKTITSGSNISLYPQGCTGSLWPLVNDKRSQMSLTGFDFCWEDASFYPSNLYFVTSINSEDGEGGQSFPPADQPGGVGIPVVGNGTHTVIIDDQPVQAPDYCPYLANGQARKLVSYISGLSHLEGQIVEAVVDGSVVEQHTVSGGAINLDASGAVIHVGLPYTGKVQLLPLGGDGQTVNETKLRKVYSVVMRLWKSLGGKFGKDEDHLSPLEYLPSDDVLFTGDMHDVPFESSVDDYWSPVFVQDDPLPFMLLATVIKSEIFEDK